TPEQRRRTAIKSILIAGGLLAVFTLFGSAVLGVLGIGMPAFRIAGGLLLFLIAVDMLFVRNSGLRTTTVQEQREAAHRADISVFPLAIPLISGPGALTTVMLLSDQGGEYGTWIVLGVTVAVLVITLIMFFSAGRIQKVLGETGTNVITRLMGIVLAALAMQFVIDGLQASFPKLVG
ncbi:MAG: MarC family protein, partial [Gammaproteobacteria bacterium]